MRPDAFAQPLHAWHEMYIDSIDRIYIKGIAQVLLSSQLFKWRTVNITYTVNNDDMNVINCANTVQIILNRKVLEDDKVVDHWPRQCRLYFC